MKRVNIVFTFTVLIASTFLLTGDFGKAQTSNFFKITSVPDDKPQFFKQFFSKYVETLGISVYASQSTSDADVLHTANMLAQYLDNDEDGTPDDTLVFNEMRDEGYAMIMYATESEFENSGIEDAEFPERGALQNLFGDETHPNGAEMGIFDASIEEVFHLVSTAYAVVYPDSFGVDPGSEISNAMDVARGGRFLSVPNQYPEDAWYTYDDTTCDYGCQVIEYMYWGMTSILGAQDFPGRLDEIEQEWRLNTEEKMRTGDPALYGLLTDTQFNLPTVLPNGSYMRD